MAMIGDRKTQHFLESWSVRKWSFLKKLVQRAAAVRRRARPSFGMPLSKMRVVHEEKGVRARARAPELKNSKPPYPIAHILAVSMQGALSGKK
jgi:hypothetical protein